MRKIALGLGVAASAIAAPAMAHDGLYFGADVGVVMANEYESEVNNVDDAILTENDAGWELGGVLGYDFGAIRTELEGAYKEFSPEQYSSSTAGLPRGVAAPLTGVVGAFGETRITSMMLNALVDFGGEEDNIGFSIGAGAGHAWVGQDLSSVVSSTPYLDDEDHNWAWQALAQLRVPVTENFDVGLKYKYFNTQNLSFTDSIGRTTEMDLTTHSALLSLIYNFGHNPAPAPVVAPVAVVPPPPPPAPPRPVAPPPPPPVVRCATGPYIVFFDWDRADITPEAAGILNSAVTAYGDCGNAAIMLAGHADRSGSTTYNEGLSQRRNVAVTNYLTGRGIPAARIASEAFGETVNRTATADGVRELQNRRVEITYGPGSGR